MPGVRILLVPMILRGDRGRRRVVAVLCGDTVDPDAHRRRVGP